jgi:hypothetical protein
MQLLLLLHLLWLLQLLLLRGLLLVQIGHGGSTRMCASVRAARTRLLCLLHSFVQLVVQ